MSRWSAVIFDWNGTLLDDARFAPEMLEKIFSHFGVKIPDLEQFRGMISSDYMEFYYSNGIPRTVTDNDIRKARADFFAENQGRIYPRDETKWLLEKCRQARLGIALISAEDESILLPQLVRYGLLEFFDFVLTDARPTKEIALRETLRFFETQPQQNCYAGDTSSDVKEARKVGMPSIALTQGLGSRESLAAANPDFLADSLTEVWGIIERNSK